MSAPRQSDTPRPSARPLAGGVSLLLVVALAVTTPAVGMQALLVDLGSGHSTVERAGLRLISGTIAQLVRGASRRPAAPRTARPGPTWATRTLREDPRVAGAARTDPAPPPRGHVRVALLDLPPPLV